MFTEEGPPRIARELDLRETVNFYVYYNNAILPGWRLKQKCNGRFSIGVQEEIIGGGGGGGGGGGRPKICPTFVKLPEFLPRLYVAQQHFRLLVHCK
jgi:hypothetical protein